MANWSKQLSRWIGWRLVRTDSLPKGDLDCCLRNIARRGLRPRHIIDVGANRGKWCGAALRAFPGCRVTMIEPQKEMGPHLEQICRGHPGCRWLLAGAGASSGELALTINPDTVSSSFNVTAQRASQLGLRRRIVPIITLDEVANQIGAVPEVIKIDAEGFEQRVLDGAQSLLGKTELIFLETHFFARDNYADCDVVSLVNYMRKRGYTPYDFTWFGKRPDDGAISLCEIAFALLDGKLRSYKGWHPRHARAA